MNTDGSQLSPQQRRLWNLHEAGKSLGSAACRVSIDGTLNAGVLQSALDRVVRKHEILRTSFPCGSASDPLIADRVEVPIEVRELAGSSPEERQSELTQCFDEICEAQFDPKDSATLRVICLRSSATRHDLILSASALTADWDGLVNLVSDLAAAYATESEAGEFDDEAMQYADVAAWQNELLLDEDSAAGLEYWRETELVAGASLRLPFERNADAAFETKRHRSVVKCVTWAQLEIAATSCKASARDFALATWAVLLRRQGTQSELLVGMGANGRQYEELQEPLGLLERYLPMPLVIEKESLFRDVLVAVGNRAEELERWQECFDWQGFGVDGAGESLSFCFDYHAALPSCESAGLTFQIEDQFALADRFKCRLECREVGSALQLVLTYDPSALTAQTVERLAGEFETLLSAAIASPESEIGRLEVLSREEHQTLVVDFNDSTADYPKDWLAHDWIEAAVKRSPDAVAVRQGDRELSYRELDERANQLAHHLQGLGVGPDSLVTLCIERSFEMVIGIVGILKAGGAYVPIDPAYPKDRLLFLLEDTSAPVLVTQEKLVDDLSGTDAKIVCLDADAGAIAGHPTTKPASDVKPANLVYIIYTSGSTGKPKGVVITHEKLVISNSARIAYFGHTPENFLLLSSVAFDSSVVGIFWSLCAGGTLELIPEGLEKDIAQIPKVIQEHKVSHLLTLPSFYRLILETADPEQLANMHSVIVAGEACPLKMVEHHKRALPTVGLFSEYGATETTVFSSVYNCLEQTHEIAPVGNPIDNGEMYVLDEHLAPCPMGVPGEVHFGGIALALGYWRRPELTAERFVSSPFGNTPGARLYKSGDLARHLEDGNLEFLGRLDNQVKIRGYRIELEEIEVALLAHPALKETAVLARSDHGEEKRLVGYVLTEEGFETPTFTELRDFLLETLPEFMAPAVIVFLDDFPRTPNGKVDRKALPEPGSERPELESDFQAAESGAETVLAQIWADVLGLGEVGVNDNFFELGGDSILSIQVVSRAKQAGFKMSARLLFENQTVAALAAAAEFSGAAEAAGASSQAAVTGSLPLTPVQHWFFDMKLPEPSHWNMPLLLDVAKCPATEQLEAALAELIAHHDILRARYRATDRGWTQEIAEIGDASTKTSVVTEDLSQLPASERQAELENRATTHHRALSISDGPLMRVVLFESGADEPVQMLWIVHHLVVDGVSWRILLEDLETALDALERGEKPKLPAKTTAYKGWSEGLARYANSEALAPDIESWKELAGASQASLPLDFPDGANNEESARKVAVSLTEEETRSLLSEVPSAYNTQINDILVTAMVHALANWTGEKTQLLNLEGHGREEVVDGVDLSRTVGWFTTDYPARITEAASFEPGDAIRSTKECLRAIPGRGFGYGVARHLSGDPELRAALEAIPTPVVGFNYLGQFDQVFSADARFRYSSAPFGAAMDPSGNRVFALEAYGLISGGQLVMDFEYSENLHKRATIEAVAEDFIATLRQLIAHCLNPDSGGFTVSDFEDFDWDDSDLSGIANAIQQSQSDPSQSDQDSSEGDKS